MASCCARNCSSRSGTVPMKRCPRDENVRSRWITRFKEISPDFTLHQNSYVCHLYFKEDQWEWVGGAKTGLRRTAVPTEFCNCPPISPPRKRRALGNLDINVEHSYHHRPDQRSTTKENTKPHRGRPRKESLVSHTDSCPVKRLQPSFTTLEECTPTSSSSTQVAPPSRHPTMSAVTHSTPLTCTSHPDPLLERFRREEVGIAHIMLDLCGSPFSSTNTQPSSAHHLVDDPASSTKDAVRARELEQVPQDCSAESSSIFATQDSAHHLVDDPASSTEDAVRARELERVPQDCSAESSSFVVSQDSAHHPVDDPATSAKNNDPGSELRRLREENRVLLQDLIKTRIQRDRFKNNLSVLRRKHENLCLNTSKRFGADQLDALARGGNLRGTKWTDETILKALKIHFAAGTNGYEMVSSTQAPLPSTRVLRQRLEHIKFRPGILTEIFDRLPAKTENMNEIEKECWLLSDEMSIRQANEFDPSVNQYVGKCTIPGPIPKLTKQERAALGNDPTLILEEGIRRSKILLETKATKAMIFLLCGFGWKLLVGYDFTGNSFCPSTVASRIVEIVRLAYKCKLRVRGLTTDMGYRAVWCHLNANLSATASEVTIPHPAIPNEEFFVMPDAVHVFKSIVEMLRTNKEITLHENIRREFNLPSRVVKMEHLDKLCSYQGSMTWKLAPSLSSSLLKLDHLKKMRVRNATDVFNRRVAAALMYLSKVCGDKSMETTAFFIDLVSKWRELVTARTPMRAFGRRNPQAFENALVTLHNAKRVFETMTAGNQWKPCQTGVKGIILVALKLIKFYLDELKMQFVMLGDFTLDPAENFMSRIRIQHPNPTALEVLRRAKKVTVSQYLGHVSKFSYEADNRTELLDLLRTRSGKDPATAEQPAEVCDGDEEEAVMMSSFQLQESRINRSMTEEEKPVFYRVCGYILKKLQAEKPSFGDCIPCLQVCTRTSPEPHVYADLLRATNFVNGALLEVSDDVFQLLLSVEEKFMAVDNLVFHLEKDLHSFLESIAREVVLPESSPLRQDCHDVYNLLVKRYIKMRCKFMSSKPSTEKASRGDKSQLSSLSMGARYLASSYTPRSSKNP